MITYEIKKPFTPTLFQRAASAIRAIPGTHDHRRTTSETYWGKLEYTKWLEEVIRPEWPRGTLCTARSCPVRESIPIPLFRVTDIQEVHWMAPLADAVNEPRAIIVTGQYGTGMIVYPPSLLRKLTEKELELVRIRDQSPEIPKTPDAVGVSPDGEFVRTNGETGEIVKRYPS